MSNCRREPILSKPLFLQSNTTQQIDEGATLKATDDPADFVNPKKNELNAFINGSKLKDIAITGKGTINGSGQRWWGPALEAKAAKKSETQKRPRMIIFTSCVGVKVQDVTLTNSPSFHLVPKDCENVTIERVTFRDPDDSPNTDAIDPSTSRHVRISHCVIDVGDDNVAIKSGRANPAYRTIRITNLTATSPQSAGFIVGVPESPITDVILENVTITAPKGLTIRNASVTLKNVKIIVQEGPAIILQENAKVEGLEQTKK